MEYGIGMFGDLRYDHRKRSYQEPKERLHEIIEEVKLADQIGIDVYAIGQHHRPDYAVSSPETLLAALSTVTKNIKLSSGVNVISSTDPVKLYQDFAMIDLLSGHRAEIMAGRGSFIESFPLFGYNLNDYNALFEEKLELLTTLNKQGEINWQGEFRPEIKNQTIYPQLKEEIPLWIAVGGTPASILRAAKYGIPIMFAIIGGMPKNFIPLVEYYREQYIKHGHDPQKMQIGVHAHTYIGDSKADVLDRYFKTYAASMDRIGRERGWAPYTDQQFMGGMSPDGALVMGSSKDVTEKIIALKEMFGLTRFVAHIDVGGPTHEEQMKTIERFGKEVVPAIKELR